MGRLTGIAAEVGALVRGRFPRFVYGGDLVDRGESQEVPVFVFHETLPNEFEADLAFLANNGYRTVDCDELAQWRAGKGSIPERAVVLAMDDGRESVWQYGLPLLRKYGMRATVFVIPGYMLHRPSRFPNLDDVWNGRCTQRHVEDRPRGHYRLLYWEEAEEMQTSGFVDVQSHSLYHHRVFQNDRLTGFLTCDPELEAFFDWPVPRDAEPLVRDGDFDRLVGAPVYRSASIFESMRRFLDDGEIRERLVARANELGGRAFLAGDPRAGRILRETCRVATQGRAAGRVASRADVRLEVESDLRQSRERIEAALGKPVRHLCFPYNAHCREARELARDAGFRSTFVGLDRRIRVNSRGGDPLVTVRLKHDFVRTLPGAGRVPLWRVLRRKARRRVRGGDVL